MTILRRLLLCAIVPLLSSQSARISAQVLQTDVISSYRGADTAGFTGLFQFAFSVEQQLNTVINAGVGADFLLNMESDALALASRAKGTYAGDLRVSNSGFGHLRYRRERRARLGVDLFTQAQWDGPRGMEVRYLLGGNVRYTIGKDTAGSVDVAAGLMYEYERWGYDGIAEEDRPVDQGAVRVSHPRINTYIRFNRQVSESLRLLFMNYLQARTDRGFDRPRIATSFLLDVAISGKVSLNVSYNSIYDFAPVVPIRRFYFELGNGITVRI